MKFKGALFDMDGVIVDNHRFHFAAWMEFAKRHNFELNEKIYREQFNGKTNADLFNMIFKNPTKEEMDRYVEEKESLYQKLFGPEMKPHTGLIDYLEYLKRERVKVALGTSAPARNVDFVLDRLRLRGFFDTIVDGSMVTKGKPHPEVYELCASKLGLEPKHCVVFEDSLAGLESGERAGCSIVALATSHKPSELKVKTDRIIHDFTEAKRYL